jgi:hypothetical protein
MRQIRPIAAFRRRAMVECSRQFIINVLVECTAERDIDQLDAATDRKHRFVIGDSPPRQGEFNLVTQFFHRTKEPMWRMSVVFWGDVAAAAEQQTVAESIMRVEHCLIIGQVDQERNAAAGFNRLQVRSSDAADRRGTLPLEQGADNADGWAFLLNHGCSLSSIVRAAARVELHVTSPPAPGGRSRFAQHAAHPSPAMRVYRVFLIRDVPATGEGKCSHFSLERGHLALVDATKAGGPRSQMRVLPQV